jgi:hypothetical protein
MYLHVISNSIFVHLQFRKMWNFTYIRLRRAIEGHGVTRTCILFSHYIICQVVNTLSFGTCLRFDEADLVVPIFTVHII